MQIVQGGGFTLLTDDPIVIAVVHRCANLQAESDRLQHEATSRYRTLRRDVHQIKRSMTKLTHAVVSHLTEET